MRAKHLPKAGAEHLVAAITAPPPRVVVRASAGRDSARADRELVGHTCEIQVEAVTGQHEAVLSGSLGRGCHPG